MALADNIIEETNLSLAWLKALNLVAHSRGGETAPLIVAITGFTEDGMLPLESSNIRIGLDNELSKIRKYQCHTVANTIFPQSLWKPGMDPDVFFARYENLAPRLKRICSDNRNGLYFDRLIGYNGSGSSTGVNQLKHIIETYKSGNHRRSALQAAILDPNRDHTNQRQRGFPCLQQVSFAPAGDGQLSITGYYATQHIFEKAYGNYIGLSRLGRFMADQLDRKLVRVICIANVAKLGAIDTTEARNLVVRLQTDAKSSE